MQCQESIMESSDHRDSSVHLSAGGPDRVPAKVNRSEPFVGPQPSCYRGCPSVADPAAGQLESGDQPAADGFKQWLDVLGRQRGYLKPNLRTQRTAVAA